MSSRLRHRGKHQSRARWIHPRRRLRPCLGACEVTWHALDSYLTRVPGAHRRGAQDALAAIAAGAELCGRTPTGEEIYEAEGMQLIVWRCARRQPVLLTVIVPERP